jgi:hypothetical protein
LRRACYSSTALTQRQASTTASYHAERYFEERARPLSHVIEDGMTTYPGLPGPQISEHMTFEESASHYAEGTEFSIATIRLVANTGTYLDTAATAVAMT